MRNAHCLGFAAQRIFLRLFSWLQQRLNEETKRQQARSSRCTKRKNFYNIVELGHQELLIGTPHVVHALEYLPVLQERQQSHEMGTLGNGIEAGRWLLRAKVPSHTHQKIAKMRDEKADVERQIRNRNSTVE